jgi:hypothetical protein
LDITQKQVPREQFLGPAWEGGDHMKISMRRKRKVASKIRETARDFIPKEEEQATERQQQL